MQWWHELDSVKKALIVLVFAFIAGMSTGASGITAVALPRKVARNAAQLDTMKMQLDYIETALVYHICEMNGNSNRPLAECVSSTRRMISYLERNR